MSRWFLVRIKSSGWELWTESVFPDELYGFLRMCQENCEGSFEILPEFEVEAQRDKIKAKDYVRFFRT